MESDQVKFVCFENSGLKPEVAVSISITRRRGYL